MTENLQQREFAAGLKPRIAYPYAWVGHIPFAYFLVDILRPRVIVELGTHSGNSYMAMCQAVKELDLDARCFAIDSWEGDVHSKSYGGQVLRDLKAAHDPLYSEFSTLEKSLFDDAVDDFRDGEIDLLHIDGLHTYQAVKHDFETWCPKLSDRAVVILHDSAVSTEGFGVAEFVSELSKNYRVFEFLHSSGLAVVEFGGSVPQEVQEFMGRAIAEPDITRKVFEDEAAKLIDPDGLPVQGSSFVPVPISSKLYYRAEGQDFSESRSVQLDVASGDRSQTLRYNVHGAEVASIRIDFAEAPGIYRVESVVLDSGSARVSVDSLDTRVCGHNTVVLSRPGSGNARIICFDDDPYVEFHVADLSTGAKWMAVEVSVDYELVAQNSLVWRMLREVGQTFRRVEGKKEEFDLLVHRANQIDMRLSSLVERLDLLDRFLTQGVNASLEQALSAVAGPLLLEASAKSAGQMSQLEHTLLEQAVISENVSQRVQSLQADFSCIRQQVDEISPAMKALASSTDIEIFATNLVRRVEEAFTRIMEGQVEFESRMKADQEARLTSLGQIIGKQIEDLVGEINDRSISQAEVNADLRTLLSNQSAAIARLEAARLSSRLRRLIGWGG